MVNFLRGLSFVLLLLAGQAFAEMSFREGQIAHRKLPPAQVSDALVRLDVPHIRQGTNLCVPTSAAMVLRYFGEDADPHALKALAEGHKPQARRNRDFTYWADMNHALRQLGYRWRIKDYPRTNAGFSAGMRDMRAHLRKGLPVLIDVHMGPGHTFVVMGYDDARQLVFVRDPDIPGNRSRQISYANLRDNWHNHQFGPSRSAFFAYRK